MNKWGREGCSGKGRKKTGRRGKKRKKTQKGDRERKNGGQKKRTIVSFAVHINDTCSLNDSTLKRANP